MSQFDHDDAIRNMLRRARIRSVDDSGSQQKVKAAGLRGEQLEKIHRFQQPGISHVPVAESEGFLLSLGGRSDRAVFFGGEHERHRPTGYAPGDTVIYDAHDNIISLVQAEMRIVHSKRVVLLCDGATIVMEGGKVRINS